MNKTAVVILVGGFALGRVTAPKPVPVSASEHKPQVHDYRPVPDEAVDCYDSNGNLYRDQYTELEKKYGGWQTDCVAGQYARLRQTNPPEHIDLTAEEKN